MDAGPPSTDDVTVVESPQTLDAGARGPSDQSLVVDDASSSSTCGSRPVQTTVSTSLNVEEFQMTHDATGKQLVAGDGGDPHVCDGHRPTESAWIYGDLPRRTHGPGSCTTVQSTGRLVYHPSYGIVQDTDLLLSAHRCVQYPPQSVHPSTVVSCSVRTLPGRESPVLMQSSCVPYPHSHDCPYHIVNRGEDPYRTVPVTDIPPWLIPGRPSRSLSEFVEPSYSSATTKQSPCPVHGEFAVQFAAPSTGCHHHRHEFADSPYCCQLGPGAHTQRFVTHGVQPTNVFHPHVPAPFLPHDERCPCGQVPIATGVESAPVVIRPADWFWYGDVGSAAIHQPDCHLASTYPAMMRQYNVGGGEEGGDAHSNTSQVCSSSLTLTVNTQIEGDQPQLGGPASSNGSRLTSTVSPLEASCTSPGINSATDIFSPPRRLSVPLTTSDAVTYIVDLQTNNTIQQLSPSSSPRPSIAADGASVVTDVMRSHTPPERDLNPCDLHSLHHVSVISVAQPLLHDMTDNQNMATKLDENITQPEITEPPSAAAASTGPSSLAFTIDFSVSGEQPQITDRWIHPAPFRTHSGVQQRSSFGKSRSAPKQRTDPEANAIAKGKKLAKKSRSKGSEAEPDHVEEHIGYLSDGHGSSVSSDNEEASICSDVVGQAVVIAGEKRFQKLGPTPSRSQPSLVQSKTMTYVKSDGKNVSSSKTTQSAGRAQVRPFSAKQATSYSSHLLSDSPKMPSKKIDGSKKLKSKTENISAVGPKNEGSRKPALGKSASVESASCQKISGRKDDDSLDVTTYLINRMFGTVTSPLNGASEGKPSLSLANKKPVKNADATGDNVSEAGTYTIDDDEEEQSDAKLARERIETVFGIANDTEERVGDGHSRIVRPVIDEENMLQNPHLFHGASIGDEDVFSSANVDDDELKRRYKIKISQAVSTAISATNHAIQQVLGLESRKKVTSSEPAGDDSGLTVAATKDPVVASENELSNSSAAGGQRHCATVVCESGGDFGTFTISYDAPSPRLRRDTQSLTRDDVPEQHENVTDDTKSLPQDQSILKKSTSSQDKPHRSPDGSDALPRARPNDSGQKNPHQPPRPSRKTLSAIPIARSVGDVARASSGENTAPLTRAVTKGRRTPPTGLQSTLSYWRRDPEMSDAASETGSTCSVGGRRRGVPKSAPATSTRTNRTFALRCAAKQRSDAVATGGTAAAAAATSQLSKPSRSRSAENNARLALAARSRSGSRARNQKDTEGAGWRRRQDSGDSSVTSMSNLSIATHDGTFVRRDGGRYSMRVEKSSTTGCLASVSKQLQLADRTKLSSVQQRAGGSATADSKELNAWKRRKEYNARKSVEEAKARRAGSANRGEHSPASPDVSSQHSGLGTADEIAKLSNAVAYNLSVLSNCSQSEAITLNPHDAVLVDSIQQMSSKVKTLTDRLMAKVKEESQGAVDVSGQSGFPAAWQNSSPELTAILENLKRTEHHLQVVHRALFCSENSDSRPVTGRLQQQRAVTRQRLQHAEQAGFRPIDNPATKSSVTVTSSDKIRRQSTGGQINRKPSSESSSNPLSGDEYY